MADTGALAVQLLDRELYRMNDNYCRHHHTEVVSWLRSALNYIRTADLGDPQVLSLALNVVTGTDCCVCWSRECCVCSRNCSM